MNVLGAVGMGVGRLAMEADTITSIYTTAVSNVKTDVFSYIAIGLPVGLAIMGAFFAIKKGVRFFKTVSN